MATRSLLLSFLVIILTGMILAGCASTPLSKTSANATTNDTSRAPPTTAALPRPTSPPPSWSTTDSETSVSVMCMDGFPAANAGNFAPPKAYASPNASALANAAMIHLSIAWSQPLPAQTLHYWFTTNANEGFSGEATASPVKLDEPASKVKPDAKYQFFICAQAPLVVMDGDYVLDLTYT